MLHLLELLLWDFSFDFSELLLGGAFSFELLELLLEDEDSFDLYELLLGDFLSLDFDLFESDLVGFTFLSLDLGFMFTIQTTNGYRSIHDVCKALYAFFDRKHTIIIEPVESLIIYKQESCFTLFNKLNYLLVQRELQVNIAVDRLIIICHINWTVIIKFFT